MNALLTEATTYTLTCGCKITADAKSIAGMCENHFSQTDQYLMNDWRKTASWRLIDLQLAKDSWPALGSYSATNVLNAGSAALQDYLHAGIEGVDTMRHAIRLALIEGRNDSEQTAIYCERLARYAQMDTPEFRQSFLDTLADLSTDTSAEAEWIARMHISSLVGHVRQLALHGPASDLQPKRGELAARATNFYTRFPHAKVTVHLS